MFRILEPTINSRIYLQNPCFKPVAMGLNNTQNCAILVIMGFRVAGFLLLICPKNTQSILTVSLTYDAEMVSDLPQTRQLGKQLSFRLEKFAVLLESIFRSFRMLRRLPRVQEKRSASTK